LLGRDGSGGERLCVIWVGEVLLGCEGSGGFGWFGEFMGRGRVGGGVGIFFFIGQQWEVVLEPAEGVVVLKGLVDLAALQTCQGFAGLLRRDSNVVFKLVDCFLLAEKEMD